MSLNTPPSPHITPHLSSFTPSHTAPAHFPTVGGGTAGSVVSARLAEERGWSVLVVEEGGPPPPETRVPAFIPLSLLPGHPTDCHHSTTPQRHGLKGYDNRVSVTLSQGGIAYNNVL